VLNQTSSGIRLRNRPGAYDLIVRSIGSASCVQTPWL
jgi:hypothetical protein